MIVGRLLGALAIALVAAAASGCASATAPSPSATRPVGVLPEPGQIFTETPQGA